jgi:hypothetical protein
VTEGGPRVQAAAREQTETLLRPHLEALLNDPRTRLPVPVGVREADGKVCEQG